MRPLGLRTLGSSDSLRFLLYSHDACGLGHLRRNLAIAAALHEAEPNAAVLLATGSDEVPSDWLPPNVDTLKLPTLRKAGRGYGARRLPLPGPDVWALRRSLLEAAVRSFRPAVLLADKHPLGVEGELGPALHAVLASGGRAALGLRDVLDDPARVRREWARGRVVAAIAEHHQLVLVFGQQALLDPVREYRLPQVVARRVRFCGYVVNDRAGAQVARLHPRPVGRPPRVLATAGGGEDGFRIVDGFIEAAAAAGWVATAVSGPLCERGHREQLRRAARRAGVAFRSFLPQLGASLGDFDALVCMGGYNTLAEAVACGTPTVCVPRVEPRREQLIRARAFSELGLLRLLEPAALTANVLRTEVAAAIRSSRADPQRRAREALDLGGAERAAAHLLDLARSVHRVAA